MDQINKPGLSRPKKKFNTTKKKKRFYPSRTQIFDLSCAKKEVPTPSSQKKRFYFSRTKKRVDLSWTNIPAPLNKKGFSFSCAEIFNLSRTKSKSNLSRTNIQYLVQKKKEVQSLMHKCPYPKNELQPLSHANVQPLLHKNEDEPLAKTFNLSCTKKRFGLSRTQMFLSSDTQTFKLSHECPISHTNTQLLSCTNI